MKTINTAAIKKTNISRKKLVSRNLSAGYSDQRMKNLKITIKELEEKLKEQERRYKTMVLSGGRYRVVSSTSLDFAFSVKINQSKKYELIWVSNGFEKEMGFNFELLLNSTTNQKQINGDDRDLFNSILNEVSEGNISSGEIRIIKKNGTEKWYQFSLYPILDASSSPNKFYGVCSNISQNKRTEQELLEQNNKLKRIIENKTDELNKVLKKLQMETSNRTNTENILRENEEHFRLLIECSPNAIVLLLDGVVTYANRKIIELFKAGSRNELLNKNILDYVHEDYKETFLNYIQNKSENIRLSDYKSIKLYGHNGKTIDAEFISFPYVQNGKRVFHLIIQEKVKGTKTERVNDNWELKGRNNFETTFIPWENEQTEYLNQRIFEISGYQKIA